MADNDTAQSGGKRRQGLQSIGLRFGAMSPPIHQQLSEQVGKQLEAEAFEHHQKDAEAVARLSIRGLMTDLQAESARQKILRSTIKDLRKEMR